MIFDISNSSQALQRQGRQQKSSQSDLDDGLASLPSFREVLTSSVLGQDSLLSGPFLSVVSNSILESRGNQEIVDSSQLAGTEVYFADRFDMTGVLGHFHAISYLSLIHI